MNSLDPQSVIARMFETPLFLGQDIKFWTAMFAGIIVKWLLSDKPKSFKQGAGGICAGMALAYYGTDPLIAHVEALEQSSRDLVVIMLTLSGEHLVRRFMAAGPEIGAAILKAKGPK